MSIPAWITLYKEGREVVTIPANASYGCKSGVDHVKGWLPFLEEEWNFDGAMSSLDGQCYYLTAEGLAANEIVKEN